MSWIIHTPLQIAHLEHSTDIQKLHVLSFLYAYFEKERRLLLYLKLYIMDTLLLTVDFNTQRLPVTVGLLPHRDVSSPYFWLS